MDKDRSDKFAAQKTDLIFEKKPKAKPAAKKKSSKAKKS